MSNFVFVFAHESGCLIVRGDFNVEIPPALLPWVELRKCVVCKNSAFVNVLAASHGGQMCVEQI